MQIARQWLAAAPMLLTPEVKMPIKQSENQQVVRKALLFGLISSISLLAQVSVFAQTNQPAAASSVTNAPAQVHLPGNRFLLIVDTSAAMKRHSADVSQTVGKIISSSASGQLHKGDTLGVWTFNETLSTGRLPLQNWVPEDIDEISLRVAQFLREQKFEKKSNLGAALDGMYGVVQRSEIITVFIISDGSGKMHGTPFDDIINANYAQTVREMKSEPRPIVTVLQGFQGKIVRFTVNAVPWPVVIPEIPWDEVQARLAARRTNAAPSKPVSPPVAPEVPQPALAQTNVPAPTPTPAVAAAPTPTSTPAPAVAPIPAAASTTNVAPVPVTAGPAKPAPIPQPSATASPAKPASSNVAVATASAPPTVTASAPAPAAAGPAVRIGPNGVIPDPNVRPNTGAAPKPQPAATNAAAPTVAAKPAPSSSTNAPANAQPSGAAAKANAFLAEVTAYAKSFASDRNRLMYTGVGVLTVLLFIAVVRRIRRANKRSRISLITASINDQNS